MSDSSAPNAASTPIPMGVLATTGGTHAPLTEDDLERIAPVAAAVPARSEKGKFLAVSSEVKDSTDLRQAGWGVLFASDEDPAVLAALQPLLDCRKKQVENDARFRVFTGTLGVRPGQSVGNWAANRGVSLVAPVSPDKGVPYYLLIVGSPEKIPFEFQQLLDLQWAVGRLYFDRVEDYASYAQKLVDYEKGLAPAQTRRAAMWMPRNQLDLATPMLVGTLAPNFLGKDGGTPLGQSENFQLTAFVGDGQATKDKLTDIFRGKIDGGAPSILFTGSHGAEWPIENPAVQRQRQGALVTQEWIKDTPLESKSYFAGSDLPDDAQVHGLIHLMFACFGGACPDRDSYFFGADGKKIPLTPTPFISALPQTLLRQGALAVIAHVDRAFSFGFEDVMGTPQPQLLRTVLELIMRGQQVGLATDAINLQWSSLAAQLGLAQEGCLPGIAQPRPPALLNVYIARDDARNYAVFGDPAARLLVSAMK